MYEKDFFSKRLLKWYKTEKRYLPWRETKNPYFVWLSEIILQQTRVAQGLSYYLNFIETYPTIECLASASEQAVLKLWQGLGYYSRAKNLHYTAKYIAKELNGIFPKSYSEIVKLKGIGDYTASAIASICYNQPEAVVDGNVYRVLGRVFNIEVPINTTQGAKYFKNLATELLCSKNAGEYNQALMDFGAMQCTPKNPSCQSCIFNDKCLALIENTINNRPVKIKKGKIKHRYFYYLVPIDNQGKTLFFERKNKDIWQGLYEFPLIEAFQELSEQEIVVKIQEKFPNSYRVEQKSETIIHKLSHQHIHTVFWVVFISEELDNSLLFSEIKEKPTAVLTANFLKNLLV